MQALDRKQYSTNSTGNAKVNTTVNYSKVNTSVKYNEVNTALSYSTVNYCNAVQGSKN